jgi:hypothetical protein
MSVSVVCFSSFFSGTWLLLEFLKHQSLLPNYDLRLKFMGSYAHKTPLYRHVNPRLLIESALRKPSLSPLFLVHLDQTLKDNNQLEKGPKEK